jgi:hypothetical protein
VPDPVYQWFRTNAFFWAWWISEQLRDPLMLFTWAVAAGGVLLSRTAIGFGIFAALLAGLGNQVGHPNASQADRLYLVAWLLVACGLPLLVDTVRHHRAAAGRARTSPRGDDQPVPVPRASIGERL